MSWQYRCHWKTLVAAPLMGMMLGGLTTIAPVAATTAPISCASLGAISGCHELVIQSSDSGYSLSHEVAAGPTLVTFTNGASEIASANLFRLPDGVGIERFRTGLTEPETMMGWLFGDGASGGVNYVDPGSSGQVIVDLEPGRYAVFDVESPQTAEEVLVTTGGEADDPSWTPVAAVSASIHEMQVELPESLTAGVQTWRVENTGDQPHELSLMKVPDGTTLDQVNALLSWDGVTPLPAGVPDPAEVEGIGGLGFIAPGHAAWVVLDLEPGTYVALCYVPDPETGAPHAMLGMVSVMTVIA